MSYDSPSDDLDSKEICEFLNLTNKMGLPDLIRYVWQKGYEWGLENAYE